eukprot:c6991_g1_i1.p1 GENE.c6991_g1_i1~~c6991_g1_i1.p1  ORF type:complete len:344 (+),score=59.98 c6991_g1_i1:3-1034(+)
MGTLESAIRSMRLSIILVVALAAIWSLAEAAPQKAGGVAGGERQTFGYPAMAAVFSTSDDVCAGLVLGLSGQIANVACTPGAMAQGSSAVNQPMAVFDLNLEAWVFLSSGALVYFNLTLPSLSPIVFNNTAPSHLELLAVSSGAGYLPTVVALDKKTSRVGVYNLNGLYPDEMPSISLAITLPWTGVSSSDPAAILYDPFLQRYWVFAGNQAAILNSTAGTLAIVETVSTPYQFLRGVSTAFVFDCLRGAIIENDEVVFATLNFTTLEVLTRPTGVLPAGTTIDSFQDYAYWDNTWIDAVSVSQAGGMSSFLQTTYGTSIGWGGQAPFEAISWVIFDEQAPVV